MHTLFQLSCAQPGILFTFLRAPSHTLSTASPHLCSTLPLVPYSLRCYPTAVEYSLVTSSGNDTCRNGYYKLFDLPTWLRLLALFWSSKTLFYSK